MTTKDVRDKFDIELNAKSDGAYDTFVDEERDEFISFGIRQFYAKRLAGTTLDRTSYEQWQKRSDDLLCIYAKYKATIPVSTGTRNNNKFVEFDLPDDYQHMLSEDVVIQKSSTIDGVTTNIEIGQFDVIECTTDNITSRLNNSLGDNVYHNGKIRPLRLYTFKENSDTVDLNKLPIMSSLLYYKADDSISIKSYEIEYTKKPNGFGIYSDQYLDSEFSADDKITQVPDHAWDEVLSIAIKHALENSSSYRIQTYNAERAEIQ